MTEKTYLVARHKTKDGVEAYVEVLGESSVQRIRYPNGEEATGRAAGILLSNDLKPVCTFEEVARAETPFGEQPLEDAR